ncbi:hypothetical protein HDV00_009070 [Rhizophlyctis rosea]|nr:hypothetical protein HDV00_009070 [Rhizophlyctis rosea]
MLPRPMPHLLFLLIVTLQLLPFTPAQFAAIDITDDYDLQSWGGGTISDVSISESLPTELQDSNLSLPIYSFVPSPTWDELSLVLWIKPSTVLAGNSSNITQEAGKYTSGFLSIFGGSSYNGNFKTLEDRAGYPLVTDQWNKIVMPLSPVEANLTNLPVPNLPPPLPPFDPSAVYLTANQSAATTIPMESGNIAQWICPSAGTLDYQRRSYNDLADVSIVPYRPAEMDMSNVRWKYYNYVFDDAYSHKFKVYGALIPHPIWGCAVHNADYFVIGNRTEAETVLVAWVPVILEDLKLDQVFHSFPIIADTIFPDLALLVLLQPHVLAAYATWVKSRRVSGRDVLAIIVRTRIPNSFSLYGGIRAGNILEYQWLDRVTPNCTGEYYDWDCPDHIWFEDKQFGYFRERRNLLSPLTNYTLAYFKETGFDVSLAMEAAPRIHATVNNVLYALPVSLAVTMMKVNTTTINTLRTKPEYSDLKFPPPLDSWESDAMWNMSAFGMYLDIMWREGYRNLFSLPTWLNGDTEYAVLSGIYFGATVLNADGRCGLDIAYEKALNETFIKWVQMPGLLKTASGAPQALTRGNLLQSCRILAMRIASPTWKSYGMITVMSNTGSNGTLLGVTLYFPIYPPTSAVKAWGNFAGVPPTSRHPALAYEALVETVARNERLHVNQAINYNSGIGTSAYKSTKNTPEYKSSNRQAMIYGLLDRAIFPGYPAEQSPSWFEYISLNPMALLFDEIRYKVG